MKKSIPLVDLVVFDADEKPALLVEIKAKKGASAAWARQMAQLIFEQAEGSQAAYFLLAMPDMFYLWPNPTETVPRGDAPFTAAPTALLRPFDRGHSSSLTDGMVNAFGLELMLSAWLNVLTDERSALLTTDEQRPFLEESGLLAAIQGGRVVSEVRATRW